MSLVKKLKAYVEHGKQDQRLRTNASSLKHECWKPLERRVLETE
jgi:hypothetical protein